MRFLALAGALLLPALHADVVTFAATGAFETGATLSGIMTINRSTGAVVGGDLAVSGIPADFTALLGQLTWPPTSPFMTELDFENGQVTNNYLTLLFPPDSLAGYTGGVLCGLTPAVCQDQTLIYRSSYSTLSGNLLGNFVELNSGSLQPTPEPSAWPSGLVIFLAAVPAVRKRRRTAGMAH